MKVYLILKFDKKDRSRVLMVLTDRELAYTIAEGMQRKDKKHAYEVINKTLKTTSLAKTKEDAMLRRMKRFFASTDKALITIDRETNDLIIQAIETIG